MTRLLVAEDDPDLRNLLALALDGYQLLMAVDGQDAIDQLEHAEVDLVVLDVMMPRIDGLEVTRRIRRTGKLAGLPVILLTAKSTESDHVRGFDVGADAYMTKPFDPQALIDRIDELVAMSPQQRERARADEIATAEFLRQIERRFD